MGLFFDHKRNKGASISGPHGTVDIIVDQIFGRDGLRSAAFQTYRTRDIRRAVLSYEEGLRRVAPGVYIGIRQVLAGDLVPVHYSIDPDQLLTLEARSIYFQPPHSGVAIISPKRNLDVLLLNIGGTDGRREADFAVREKGRVRELHASYRDGFVPVADGVRLMVRTVEKGNDLPMWYLVDDTLRLAWVTYDPKTFLTSPVSP